MRASFAACKNEDCEKSKDCARYELGSKYVPGLNYIEEIFINSKCVYFIPKENKKYQ